MRIYFKAAWAVVAVVLISPVPVWAQNETAVSKAQAFLENEDRAKGILFFAHPEAKFQGVQVGKPCKVVDADRNVIPGRFALVCTYSWKSSFSGDDNTTDLVFFFDRAGRFYWVQTKGTSSSLTPFGLTDIVVKAVRDDILKQVEKHGTETDKKVVRTLLANGDAKGLLTLLLKYDQP